MGRADENGRLDGEPPGRVAVVGCTLLVALPPALAAWPVLRWLVAVVWRFVGQPFANG